MHIYHSRWHELTDEHIKNLTKKYLGDDQTFPFTVLPELRRLQKATLELVGDNVFRIKETGQLTSNNQPGKINENLKLPVFIIYEVEDVSKIERTKPPKFIASYNPTDKTIYDIEWTEGEPKQITLISTLKKARGFLKNSVK